MSKRIYEKSNLLETLTPVIIITVIIAGIILSWVYLFSPALDSMSKHSSKISEENKIDIARITEEIKTGKVTCEYVSDLRMQYAGDSFVNALSNSWIKSKLQTYWNTHNCGVEWEWWD